jgi:hypothetical protein
MHKNEVFVMGIVSILVLGAMLIVGEHMLTGLVIDEYGETFEMGTQLFKHAPQQYPRLSYSPLSIPAYDPAELPSKAALTPDTMMFHVDRILVPEMNYQYAISLRRDRLHTYSGSAGFFAEDPTPFLDGYLCSYAYEIMGAPLRCERVPLSYADGSVRFVRGYDTDEFIGGQAQGTDFAAVFLVANREYGILAASPTAFLRWTNQ